MWKTKLCLRTNDQFELSVPEQIKLFKKSGLTDFLRVIQTVRIYPSTENLPMNWV